MIKSLVVGVVDADELDDSTKNEVIELADSLTGEIIGSRKFPTIVALAKGIREKVGRVLALSNAAEKITSAIQEHFG